METIDVQTYSGGGPYTIPLSAIRNRAKTAVPDQPDMVWGVARIRLECAFTVAALSAMAGATPGKRVQELLDRLEIEVAGWPRPACYANGRTVAELRRVQEGKLAFADPTDLADADATLTPRYVFEFVFRDPRLADRIQHVPHAAALGDGAIRVAWLTSALVTGVTFTSVVLTTRVEYVPIPRDHMPIPISLYDQALGNGVVSATRISDIPIPDGLFNLWLYLRGIRTSGGARPQFLETSQVTLDAGGKRILDHIPIQTLVERIVPDMYDAAAEEASATPEVLHLLFPPQTDMLVGTHGIEGREGTLEFSASVDDSGNTSTELRVVTYGAVDHRAGSESDRRYAAAIQPVHFPGVQAFTSTPKAANGKTVVPLRLAGLVPRKLYPVKS